MIFDGSELVINDSVYDVAYGSGKVIELSDSVQSFRVAFGPRSFTYDLEGFGTFPRKTLYWRDPISGFIPPKDTMKWDMFIKLRTAIYSTLGL
jgi:hypothetical protein